MEEIKVPSDGLALGSLEGSGSVSVAECDEVVVGGHSDVSLFGELDKRFRVLGHSKHRRLSSRKKETDK